MNLKQHVKSDVLSTLALAAIAVLAVGTVACADPAADKPKASVTAPAASSAAAPAAVAPGSVVIALSPANAGVAFVGSKVTGSHNGSFKGLAGSVVLDPGGIEKSTVTVDIDVSTVETDAPQLTEHLKSPDFFDVARFPKATFVSTAIVAKPGDKGATHAVTGDFEIHGVRKSITFPAKITTTADGVTVESEFSINRKDFGIVYAGKADDLIRDDVVLKLTVNARKG